MPRINNNAGFGSNPFNMHEGIAFRNLIHYPNAFPTALAPSGTLSSDQTEEITLPGDDKLQSWYTISPVSLKGRKNIVFVRFDPEFLRDIAIVSNIGDGYFNSLKGLKSMFSELEFADKIDSNYLSPVYNRIAEEILCLYEYHAPQVVLNLQDIDIETFNYVLLHLLLKVLPKKLAGSLPKTKPALCLCNTESSISNKKKSARLNQLYEIRTFKDENDVLQKLT